VKVLQATTLTQGARPNDFNFCTEGELVVLPVGSHDGEPADGPCGCNRALSGSVSHRATTTAVVADADATAEEWLQAVARSLVSGGWAPSVAEVPEELLEAHRLLLDAVQSLPLGTVVEFREWRLLVRKAPAAC
jgi:hypothetical protein